MSAIDAAMTDELTDRVRLGLVDVRARIVEAGGKPSAITVVAVTKGFGPEAVLAATRNGLGEVGENFADELVDKAAALSAAGFEQPRWNFQGALQTNKIHRLRAHVSRWQSVDSEAHAAALAVRVPGAAVFVQVNVTGQNNRGGCAPADVARIVERCRAEEMNVEGLMAVGPIIDGQVAEARSLAASERAFASLRTIADRLGLGACSMGMSQDLAAAVRAGTTMVRIGSALFGPRP